MKKKKLLWQLPFLAFLIIGTVVIVGRQKSVPYQHDEGRIFGTTYHITYQSDDNLKKEIEETLKAVDQEFSMFNPQSTVALINEGKRPTLSDDFLEVYQLAQQVNEESDGAFDITVAPLVNAWGFGFKNQQMPNNHQIDSLRRLVGMEHVSLAGAKGSQYMRFQRPRMMLDFSAIAKGYGTDRVARLLMSHDVANFMVEIGGEVYAKGNREAPAMAHRREQARGRSRQRRPGAGDGAQRHKPGHGYVGQLPQLLLQGRTQIRPYHRS